MSEKVLGFKEISISFCKEVGPTIVFCCIFVFIATTFLMWASSNELTAADKQAKITEQLANDMNYCSSGLDCKTLPPFVFCSCIHNGIKVYFSCNEKECYEIK
jgi:hypothetical protein